MEGTKKIKSTSFHQYSWNSEVETTWISLIGWQHKTSSMQVWEFINQKLWRRWWPIAVQKSLAIISIQVNKKLAWSEFDFNYNKEHIICQIISLQETIVYNWNHFFGFSHYSRFRVFLSKICNRRNSGLVVPSAFSSHSVVYHLGRYKYLEF